MKKHLLGMALGALLAAAPAMAQQAQPNRTRGPQAEPAASVFLEQFDSDGDGAVSWEQFVQFRKQRYADTDENGDGTVDTEEYASEYLIRLDRRLEAARQGQVEQTRVRFKALDKDGDGFVSRAEYDASGERAFAHFENSANQAEPPRAQRRSPLNMPSTHSRAGMLEIYDADGDGTVTRAEYDRGRDEAFARTDTDGDGRLDADEYLAEFEDRLDRRIASTRESSSQQAHVRFKAIDSDHDGRMSWDEYAASGKRVFERADGNGDGVVDARDPAPTQPHGRTPSATAPRDSDWP